MKNLLPQLPSPPPNKTGWPWTEETNPPPYDEALPYPKISIITPSFNQGAFIEETIRSVLLQNYPCLEYIVIDGGSTDETVGIIKQYAPWITHWVSEKDRGQSHAINKGLLQYTGEVCNWINSDDLLLPGALHKVAAHFRALPDTTGVIHGGVEVFRDGVVLATNFLYAAPGFERYITDLVFSQPAAFVRRPYLSEVGLLNESLHYGMDYDLFARLACVCDFQPVNDLFAKYRLHRESKTVASNEKFRADRNRAFFSLCRFLGGNDIPEGIAHFLPELKSTPALPVDYSFVPRKDVLAKANKRKILFYFLADTLKHFYWFDRRSEARTLLKKMKAEFPKAWFAEDRKTEKVVQKLQLPETALRLLKSIKRLAARR